MKLSRDFQRPLRYVLDQLLPPVIRDSFIVKFALKIVFKSDSGMVWNFRRRFPTMTDQEVHEIYARLSKHALKSSTDINGRCFAKVNTEMVGKSVLDAGCGTGKLAESNNYIKYVGVDFVEHVLWDTVKTDSSSFYEMSVEKMEFDDDSFDLVVCAHVLEHVRRPEQVLMEIRRLTKSKAIIILPRERSYVAGFNLHVNHYQYEWEIEDLFNQVPGVSSSIELIDGDFYCKLEFNK
jgi:ubiquinone/menaquinone biosynthesis C-methylase UbiE